MTMATAQKPLLRATKLSKIYKSGRSLLPSRRQQVHAVNEVSLEVMPGETLGIVGESGCGKSSLGRCLTRLQDISSGRLEFDGRDITDLSLRQIRPLRREMQMVFQDPAASLNARRRVGDLLAEPFRIHGIGARSEIEDRVSELLRRVGLRSEHALRFPHEFSGGQKQRIGIARALALHPKLLVADEPVSALDVSIQAQIINLLAELREEFGLTYVFIAHDLAVVRQISNRVAVMYLGAIVEVGDADEVFSTPRHPYTRVLREAMPEPRLHAKRPERAQVKGDLPSPFSPPPGCPFHTRCAFAKERREVQRPALVKAADGRAVACHYPLDGPHPTGLA
ncbi:ABC transporter ATP-binding protein [Tropicimonas isoalkanivorans]|uniref:Peptide/nickel transport system ATP-binding protein n=1 Tax=Tropicimonas isoalkanivorans TaxID=441112 RepID=A0A1I1DH00_9RHOB|nr:oligopeptide/dipeptide ABC transporter ATP-binding protein [Tropicimonas isoalkanivorans]SFB74117.1 peptide/nickel transport system ATP-binding protein [Tropicimonas isoalkanivorans]